MKIYQVTCAISDRYIEDRREIDHDMRQMYVMAEREAKLTPRDDHEVGLQRTNLGWRIHIEWKVPS